MPESDKETAPEKEAAAKSENTGEKPASNSGQPSDKKNRSGKKSRKEKNKSDSQPQAAPEEAEAATVESATEESKAPDSAPDSTPQSSPPTNSDESSKSSASAAPEAPFPPKAQKNEGLRGSPLLGLVFGTIGIFTVCGLGLVIFAPEHIPYVLTNLDATLDNKVRYQTTGSVTAKDWRKDLQDEQVMWTNEISKIKLGTSGAKPLANKRDFLLFLADAYYRDQPHYMEAKAAYMAALQEPRLPHEHAYEMSDGELHQRIGICALRMHFYNEAEEQMQQALTLAEAINDPKLKVQRDNGISLALDGLTECYIRDGKLDKAEALLKRRLEMIQQTDPKNSIEVPLLFNFALLREAQGNLKEAEEYYKLALTNNEHEDVQRGVVKDSPNDNSRKKAFILREYARLLRKENRPDQAQALMQRAVFIANNPL